MRSPLELFPFPFLWLFSEIFYLSLVFFSLNIIYLDVVFFVCLSVFDIYSAKCLNFLDLQFGICH